MDEDYTRDLLFATGSIQAVFLALLEGAGTIGKRINEITIDSLAGYLERSGVSADGTPLTVSQVRHRINELIKRGSISLIRCAPRGFFSITILADPARAISKKRKNTQYPLFESSNFQREIRSEIRAENENEKTDNILSNINKERKKEPALEIQEPKPVKPSAADIRKDANYTRCEKIRADIVKRIWEPELLSDLADRTAFAVVNRIGSLDWDTLLELISKAKKSVLCNSETSGRFGRSAIWKTINYAIRGYYVSAGWEYPCCRIENGHEPRPEQEQQNRSRSKAEVSAEERAAVAKRLALFAKVGPIRAQKLIESGQA